MKEECTETPANYSFDASRVSRALNHSTVRLSWDQTDSRLTSRLASNYKKVCQTRDHEWDSAAEDEAYKGLLAGSSEEDSDDDVSPEAKE